MQRPGKEEKTDAGGPAAETAAVRDALRLYGHDIRAAMSDVIGGLRLMDLDRLPPDLQSQIERVRVASETLAELLDGAMMQVSGEVGHGVASQSFAFRSFLAEIDLSWSGRAREQGLSFLLEVQPQVPERVQLAKIELDRILGNLIANAMKFTDAGEVSLKVGIRDGTLQFCVRDEGQGFSDPALERLFLPGGRPADERRPGSGLGLHISKELAVRLGGTLSVRNRQTRGACVSLRIPAGAWECRDAPVSPPDLSGLTILVAEDNETNQILVRQMLEGMGARMVLARDGQEALDLLARAPVDIALIDIEMPRLTGIEVMQRLRARTGFDIPLIALTAYVMRENREAIYAAGADGVIAKPIGSVAGFGTAIRRHVDDSGPRDTAHAPPETDEAPKACGTLDRNRFEAILQAAGPDGRVEFLTHLLQDLRAVRADMNRAIRDSDRSGARAGSHILISLAGAVGADRLQQLAESLNAAAHRDRLPEARSLIASCDSALTTLITEVERRARREAGG